MIKISGYDPSPICWININEAWYPVNPLANPVSPIPGVVAAFENWALNPVDENGDPVDIDPESENYFFAPGPEPEPPPPTPDYPGFVNAALVIPGFLDYLDSGPPASVAVLMTAINNLREGFNADSLANAIAGWNRIVAHAAPDGSLITALQSAATEKNTPFVFAQDGTVSVGD